MIRSVLHPPGGSAHPSGLAPIPLLVVLSLIACVDVETVQETGGSPTDVSGRWVGVYGRTVSTGAAGFVLFHVCREGTNPSVFVLGGEWCENVVNPNCLYGANLTLDLNQSGPRVTGTATFETVRADKNISSPEPPCNPQRGVTFAQSLSGDVVGSSISFTLGDGVTQFSGEWNRSFMGGSFSSPTTQQFVGVRGAWGVCRPGTPGC